MKAIAGLFGIKSNEPSEGEKAAQADRLRQANQADAEADQKVALAGRADTLRKSLAFRDDSKKATLGG